MIRATISCLATACLVAVASPASAAPKVALTAIEGDTTGTMRDAVAAALDGDQLTVLGERETNRAVDGLHNENLDELTEKQASKLTKELEADAVVTASLGKKGKAKTLHFKLFVNGKKQRGFTVQFKNPKSSKFKTALRDKLVDRISGDGGEVAKAEPAEEAVPKKHKITKSEPAEDEENPNPTSKKAAKDKPKEVEGEGDEDLPRAKKEKKKTAARGDDDDEAEPALVKRLEPAHTANRAAARIDAGVSFGNRSLVFNQRANFPEGPKPFRSSPVPGARFNAELYPFAFMNPNSILAGLGGAAEYDKTLALNLQTTAEPGKTVKVDQSAYSFGGRFRFAFGKRATSPTVTAGVDYGRRRWKADRSVLTDQTSLNGLGALDLPDTNYAFIAPGLGFRIPIGEHFALAAGGKALFVSKAGPIQKANAYGKAKITGFDARAGFDIVFANRFALRVEGQFVQFGYSFIGTGGELVNSRDGDAMSKDIGGATDRSIGGLATLGVLY